MAKSPHTAVAKPSLPPLPCPANTIWAARWWRPKPTKFPWLPNSWKSWIWRAASSAWMPCTPKPTRPARWCWRPGRISSSPLRTTSRPSTKISKNSSPPPRRISPPWQPTPTELSTVHYDKGRLVNRSIVTQAVCPEQLCFPLVAQAARVLRQTEGRKPEHVTLLTSAEPEQLDPRRWLELNQAGFGGLENGLHH